MRILGVIPARGGSKGIPHKNLALVGGRPLLAYTAEACRQSTTLTRVIVSTDDEAIAAAARALGLEVPFPRPATLAGDETPMLPVVQHALDGMREAGFSADVVVLLQPTSPLRRGDHIDDAVERLAQSGADSVVSVVEVPHQFNPLSVMRLDGERLRSFLDAPTLVGRQSKPRLFARNGPAVLAVRASVVAEGSLYGDDCRPLLMSAEDSIDIDSPWDLALAELVLASRRRAPVRTSG